ncbi:MAG TPA: polysaccharide biosynthesis C-terminal domain-containing protein, partial [Acidimicrobiales bacterium]|nr:polysaccharide biosynthesis C-terminal domain-containing protein [Acidimicrobiales bacterium]
DARGDRQRLTETLLTGTRYTLAMSWPLTAGVAMLASPGIRLWTGAHLAATASAPTRVAMVAMALGAVSQVAGNILLGAGRGVVILRATAIGVLVDLGASVALVYPLGVAGVFWGTLVSLGVTTPWLAVAACRYCGTDLRHFLVSAVFPPAIPALAEVAVLGVVVALGMGPSETLAIGVPLGAAVVVATTLRWTLPRRELAGLFRSLRGRPDTEATDEVPPGAISSD